MRTRVKSISLNGDVETIVFTSMTEASRHITRREGHPQVCVFIITTIMEERVYEETF